MSRMVLHALLQTAVAISGVNRTAGDLPVDIIDIWYKLLRNTQTIYIPSISTIETNGSIQIACVQQLSLLSIN